MFVDASSSHGRVESFGIRISPLLEEKEKIKGTHLETYFTVQQTVEKSNEEGGGLSATEDVERVFRKGSGVGFSASLSIYHYQNFIQHLDILSASRHKYITANPNQVENESANWMMVMKKKEPVQLVYGEITAAACVKITNIATATARDSVAREERAVGLILDVMYPAKSHSYSCSKDSAESISSSSPTFQNFCEAYKLLNATFVVLLDPCVSILSTDATVSSSDFSLSSLPRSSMKEICYRNIQQLLNYPSFISDCDTATTKEVHVMHAITGNKVKGYEA